MANKRSQIAKEDCWNVEALYPSLEAWEKELQKIAPERSPLQWPELATFKGRLHESAKTTKEALEQILTLSRQLSKLYTYAHLRHDEEMTEDRHKSAFKKITTTLHRFAQETSWLEPELLALSEAMIKEYLASPILADYRFHLEKILRLKPHTLSSEKEELIALAGQLLQTSYKVFSALNDADFRFKPVVDSQNSSHELTHGQYSLYIRQQDRVLRKNAFFSYHEKYQEYENSLTELLSGQVQSALFGARSRHYQSCLEAALFPKNIDPSVYHTLVKTVNDQLSSLHKYLDLRKKVLEVEELHLYDLYVPMTADLDLTFSYAEAEEIIIDSVAPLGNEYQKLLKEGLQQQRWVDRYENQNKRSGAYSSGCYDSMPYILMNYNGTVRDLFTLAHEAGHSMHSFLSHKHQPYHYSEYPIFLAEVASTFNEELLMQQLLKHLKSDSEKIFLINQKIEDIRATLFRQTLFAEFELLIHTLAEKEIPLTPKLLREEYRKLNQTYYGKNVVIDTIADIEWARIPHFYYNFYIFQYATGISAALALAENVLQGEAIERNNYLSFLKAGCSRFPIDILQTAGVDMRSAEPIKRAIHKFSLLVDQLNALLSKNRAQATSLRR